MKRRLALFAVLAGIVAAPVASAPAATAPLAAQKTCSAGYVHAYLSWGEKCLRAGEFCKVGNREYLKYGFSCPPTRHLRRR